MYSLVCSAASELTGTWTHHNGLDSSHFTTYRMRRRRRMKMDPLYELQLWGVQGNQTAFSLLSALSFLKVSHQHLNGSVDFMLSNQPQFRGLMGNQHFHVQKLKFPPVSHFLPFVLVGSLELKLLTDISGFLKSVGLHGEQFWSKQVRQDANKTWAEKVSSEICSLVSLLTNS